MRTITTCVLALVLLSSLAFGQEKYTEVQKATYSAQMINRFNTIRNSPPSRSNDLTMFLVDVELNKSKLTDAALEYFSKSTTAAYTTTYNSPKGYFQVYYSTSGTDSVDITCTNDHGVPDYIDVLANCLDSLYERYQEMGFTKVFIRNGQKFSVNVSRTACANRGAGIYGFCSPVSPISSTGNPVGDNPATPDIVEKNAYIASLTINSNFRDFESKPTKITEFNNIRITCAHEFMHATQFGYDLGMITSCKEGCAVWAETTIYPGINQYMQYSDVITNPEGPMDYNNTEGTETSTYNNRWYSSWVFHRFLSEKKGNDIIPKLYKAFIPPYTNETDRNNYLANYIGIYNSVLSQYGTSFSETTRDVYTGLAMLGLGKSDETYGFENASALKTYWQSRLGRAITFEKTITISSTETVEKIEFNSYTDPTSKKTLKRHGCNNIKIVSPLYNYKLTLSKMISIDEMDFVLVRFDKSAAPTMLKVERPTLQDGKYVFDVRDCSTYKTAVLLCVNMNNGVNLLDEYYTLELVPDYNPVEETPAGNNSLLKNVAYANPSNGCTNFSFDLVKSGSATIELVDMTGYVVSTIANEMMTEGHKSFDINTPSANGMYFVRVRHADGTYTYPLSIVR